MHTHMRLLVRTADKIRFMTHVLEKGHSVLVIRDKGGHVFGGYAGSDWVKAPKFYGPTNCFVFAVRPHAALYRATGDNNNFMYLNHASKTLYNGIGMGGQVEFFAWTIPSDFDHGSCRSDRNSTFGCPILAASADFQIDLIEVWQTMKPVVVDMFGNAVSVLNDEDNPDKKIVEMMGHEFASINLGPNVNEESKK